MGLDEREAARRAKRGDPEAFGVLVERHEAVAFRVAYLVVRDEAEAQDVAQEAFIRAYRSLGRFDEGQPFRPWLLRIVTNLAINSTRGAKRLSAARERYERDAASPVAPSPEAATAAAAEAERVWAAVGRLDGDDQALVYLRYFLDASEREAAEAIGRPVGTVKSRTHRALRKLREIIEREFPDLLPERLSHEARAR